MELLEKYGLVIINNQRFYVEDLTKRDFTLESTTPYSFSIETKTFKERAWVNLLPKIAIYLQQQNPKDNNELLSYRTNWSKSEIYSANKRTNSVEIEESLFISVFKRL